jgi:hypothetical protein
MRWNETDQILPAQDEEVICCLADSRRVFRGKFDRSNIHIHQIDRKKFWERLEENNFKMPPYEKNEVIYWIPFPKFPLVDRC